MGWWTPKDIESGQPDTRPENAVLIGDEVADVMGDALDKINSIYEAKWNRKPQMREVRAIFNFVYKARGYKEISNQDNPGSNEPS